MDVKKVDKQYIANTYGRADVCFVSGKGSLLYDENGKEYIDLGSGIAVNTFGIADDEWVNAVCGQAKTLQHVSNLYYTKPQAELAKLICERSGMKKVFFGNSGAEANECAIKTARKYSHDKYGSGRAAVITLKSSFHGRTVTTLAATGQDVFHTDFMPFTEGFVYTEPNDTEKMKKALEDNSVCAVMMEIIQGEGGVNVLDGDFVRETAKLCTERDILLIVDEVQTGNGRTGELYGYMNYGIQPDIVSTAKGLGGGLPIGAALLGDKVEYILGAGDHGSTFGGNPAVCAGAYNIISRIDERLLEDVKRKSKYIFDALTGAPGIVSVSGLGLMIGVETVRPASDIINECIEKGVLVIKAKNKLRLLPALNIPDELLAKAVDIIKECAKGN